MPQNQCLVNLALLESNKTNSPDIKVKKQIIYDDIPNPLCKNKSDKKAPTLLIQFSGLTSLFVN